jgi:hypothetical protein
MPLATIEVSSSSTIAIAGSCTQRRKMFARIATAQISATNMRIVFAGSTAFTSVYDAPVRPSRSLNSNPYRSR